MSSHWNATFILPEIREMFYIYFYDFETEQNKSNFKYRLKIFHSTSINIFQRICIFEQPVRRKFSGP